MSEYRISDELLDEVKSCLRVKIEDDAADGYTEAAKETAELLLKLDNLSSIDDPDW